MWHSQNQRLIFTRNQNHFSLIKLFGFLLIVGLFSYSHLARALPSYARQTEQSCVACHAGGQFPELTPYGRMFKLTGYTMGQQTVPLAVMMQAGYSKVKNLSKVNDYANTQGTPLVSKDSQVVMEQASVFLAGKITNSVGLFSQFTYSPYNGADANGNFKGYLVQDLTDLRYANNSYLSNNDLIFGLTVHNTISVQDVWNSSPAWGYPYVSRNSAFNMPDVAGTFIEGGAGSPIAGTGIYTYINKNFYLELTGYQTAKNALSIMSMGYHPTDGLGNNLLTYVSGVAPYLRTAYTREWGPHNIMLGASYLDIKIYPGNDLNSPTGTNFSSGTTRYKDFSIDSQYQYLLSPHTITASFRYVHENIGDGVTNFPLVATSNLNTYRAKVSYIYQAKYGSSLAYSVSNGSDTSLVNNSSKITPEIFWMPVQNVRLGAQYNYFTKYQGLTGSDATNNNSLYLYLWLAY